MSFSPELVAFLVAGITWILWRMTSNFILRSPLDNIPGPASVSWVKGNLGQLYYRHGWNWLDSLGNDFNKVVKLTGLFGHRMLYVFDPVAMNHILIKDAEDVYDHPEWSFQSTRITVGPGLLGVHGTHHRKQRKMLNPVFSVKHLRSMTTTFYSVVHRMSNGIEAEVGNDTATVDVMEWFGRTALELIGQGGLGVAMDSLGDSSRNPLADSVKMMIPAIADLSEVQYLFEYVKYLGPTWFKRLLARLTPSPTVQRLRKAVSDVEAESKKILSEKRAGLQAGDEDTVHNLSEKKDVMSILLQANMAASDADRLPEDELLAQMSTFILAGTDTTSNALTAMMCTLAKHVDIQDKLRAEILEAQAQFGEDIPYDDLVALPYMDAFVRESLRLYAPATFITREAKRDFVLPVSDAVIGVNGTAMREIPVPKGTTIYIGLRASNLDKRLWGDDALEFKPERWLSPLPATVTDARIPGVYSNLMTFNGGGRSCIGFKFSQLETKVVLNIVLGKFKVSKAKQAEDIVWNMAGVRHPTMKGSIDPTFPVNLERIKA
ncbi:hypothetical protein QCA50_015517 [Cerrena zonata]|uniref:Cytochrome P450 n=1 Tax=Cerrena zonata TaxID=2478898 RepID=A0AAW0FR74_9APHY